MEMFREELIVLIWCELAHPAKLELLGQHVTQLLGRATQYRHVHFQPFVPSVLRFQNSSG
jgi:hypothetical protein